MQIQIIQAKNSEKSLKIDNVFFHSSYNPTKEAQNFVNSLQFDFTPKIIFFIEPGIGYTYNFLKSRFPNTKVVAIHMESSLLSYTSEWDYNFVYYKENLKNIILNNFNPYDIILSKFINLPVFNKIFENQLQELQDIIKNIFETVKTLLITQEHFEQKWFINSLFNSLFIKQSFKIPKNIDKPVLIVASGPSLKNNLKILQKYQERFFIICLSSAINVLINNNITPDICFSCDGGYYAGEHLKPLLKYKLPLILSLEAYCPKTVLNSISILPLIYGDEIIPTNEILSTPALKGQRCGTVSGSALNFAIENFTTDIYFFGLDLACQKGFAHTQPNILELNNSITDNYIKNSTTRNYKSEINEYSLNIYADWFKSQNFSNRKIVRVIENSKNCLGHIIDMDSKEFLKLCENLKDNKKVAFDFFNVQSKKLNIDEISKLLDNYSVQERLFPMESMLVYKNQDEYNQSNKITKKILMLKEKIKKYDNK